MNKLFALMMAGAIAVAAPVFAADAPATNSQQEKMKACNAKAEGKAGDERKAFMKSCLSAKPAAPESKMAMCNKQTAGLSGDARSKAQSECMKGSSTAATSSKAAAPAAAKAP
jgi:hypothetical protein